MKICKKCGIEKMLDYFPTNNALKDGKMNTCKLCYYNNLKEKTLNRKIKKIENGEIPTKICNICKVKKTMCNFNKSKLTFDGYLDGCKRCKKELKLIRINISDGRYKICRNCIINKKIFEFSICKRNRKDGHFNTCKECERVKGKKYHHEYTKLNKVKLRKGYTPEERLLSKLKKRIRSSICNILKSKGLIKNSKTLDILGCTIEEFKIHLESKFEPWMSWENRGKYNGEYNYGWDIDHIIPASSGTTYEELLKLSHYTNLQPLCSKINRDIKKDLIDYEIF